VELLRQLGFSLHDTLLAAFVAGVWWGSRNRKATGERLGVVEDAVAEVRGIVKALGGGNGDKR